jgi:predicted ATPase
VSAERPFLSLLRRWARARAGEGQVVLISGEPGLGKSRVTAVLEEQLQAEPHLRLRYFCSPYHQDSALFPFIGNRGSNPLGDASKSAILADLTNRLSKVWPISARRASPRRARLIR